MEINVNKLISGEVGETADYTLKEELPIPDKGNAAIQGKVKLTRLDQSMLANFDITANITLNCDKCLESFRQQIPLNFEREYLIKETSTDPEVLTLKDKQLNTDSAITQEIIINLPLQAVCKPDCKGLCPVCGINLNRDTCEHVNDGSTTKEEN